MEASSDEDVPSDLGSDEEDSEREGGGEEEEEGEQERRQRKRKCPWVRAVHLTLILWFCVHIHSRAHLHIYH